MCRTILVTCLAVFMSLRATSTLALTCTAPHPHAQWASEGSVRQLFRDAAVTLIGRVTQSGPVPCHGGFVYYRMQVTEVLKGSLAPAIAGDGTIVVAHQVWEGCRASNHDLGPPHTSPLLYLGIGPREIARPTGELEGRKASLVLGPCSFGYDVTGQQPPEAHDIRERLIDELR